MGGGGGGKEVGEEIVIMKERSTSMFIFEWKPLVEYLQETEKNDVFVWILNNEI